MSRINTAVSLGAAFVVTILTSPLGKGDNHAALRCTTWNVEWFPNGSPHDASPEAQNRRITDT
jgi:hypothetical protein